MRGVQARGVLLRQCQQDVPPVLGLVGGGQERDGLLLQARVREREHADGAGAVRGLPCQLLLCREGGHDTVRDQRGIAGAITGFDTMLLRLGMERGEQRRVCRVRLAYVLLHWVAGTVL